MNPVEQVQQLGQSIWYDNIRRGMISSGQLSKLIDVGVTGLTSNPTIFEKAIVGSTDYDAALLDLDDSDLNSAGIFEQLANDDIRAAAGLLRPIYDRSLGVDGYASLEVSPHLAHDTQGTIEEARRLFASLDQPNVMIKVPATPEGIPAVRRLIGLGINVNVTLIFSLNMYSQVSQAYIQGLEDLQRAGGDLSKVASVASFFVSRVDSAADLLIEGQVAQVRTELSPYLGGAAIANAKLAYRAFQQTFSDDSFSQLRRAGARVQRPLWASTGTKNPAYSDVRYIEELIGQNTVNTVPEATLTAFLEHGAPSEAITTDVQDAQNLVEALETSGVSLKQVTDKLLSDGLMSFADSYDKLLANIDQKRAVLRAKTHEHPAINIGEHLLDVEAAILEIESRDLVERMWGKDHTIWNHDPTEIADRLGWLALTDLMTEQIPALEGMAAQVREEGYQHVVLLGMGGSSLGPEVLRRTFGKAEGYPELIVLDSTVPDWVRAVTDAIDPARSLFLVSSKSGSTLEPNTYYSHFRSLVDAKLGKERAGHNFVAVTDPGTPLEGLAREQGFRRTFGNPPDIGGRYSVLSYFGLVPAVLTGVDIRELLDRAYCMREGSAACVPTHDNPGAWLGTVMGVLAKQGRDKLTLVTSPSIASYGLWAEQLIAESTGKGGVGIIPVAGEPLIAPEYYGNDRLFTYLRLAEDDNGETDSWIDKIAASGQPVIRLDLRNKYDVGAEFYRWEFATAVAGAVLGINPFDQPNVQGAKDMTDKVLDQFQTAGHLPEVEAESSLISMLRDVQPGDYLAILAYLRASPSVDLALDALRGNILRHHGIATTVGYGPRYLHSTGQLHKGGPASGRFLQLVGNLGEDLPIPGKPYTFGTLAAAQALGDLQALQDTGRRVARVDVGADAADAILRLAEKVLE